MRNLLTPILLLAASGAASAAPVSACPPKEVGLGMVQNFSAHRRWSELCSVTEAEIVRQVDSSIKLTASNCLRPQHVPQATIDQSLAAGREMADKLYAQMPDKAAHCTRIKASYQGN